MKLREGTQDAATLNEVRAYRPLGIGPADRVLDLGGCIGAFGAEAFAAGASEAVAYEPDPENAALYRENVPEALVIEAAVDGHDGHAVLWQGSSNSHSLIQRRGRTGELIVPTATLPHVIETWQPTVVKADIEGSEYDLDWTRLDGVRALAVELHFTPKRHWRQEARRVAADIEAQGFTAIKPLHDTGKNWHCVAIWHREPT